MAWNDPRMNTTASMFHVSSISSSQTSADIHCLSRYRTYAWTDRTANHPVNLPNNIIRPNADLPNVYQLRPRLSFRQSVRSDFRAVARALGARSRYRERQTPDDQVLAPGPVMVTLLRGGNGPRTVIVSFGLRPHDRVERRLARRSDARSLTDIPEPDPLPSTPLATLYSRLEQTDDEPDTRSMRNLYSFSDSGESVNEPEPGFRPSVSPEHAYEMTASNNEGGPMSDSEELSASLLDPRAPHQVDEFDAVSDPHEPASPARNQRFQRLLARRQPFWLRRHAMGGFPSDERVGVPKGP